MQFLNYLAISYVAHCPHRYYELGTWDCPTGFDIFSTECIKHNRANDVAEIIDRANEEINSFCLA